MEIPELIAQLDAKRLERGMSYQTVADACGVSKATIYRALTGATEPTAQLLNHIDAAVQYVPPVQDQLPPVECSEAYISYLRAALHQQTQDYNRHSAQLQTHYSMLHRQPQQHSTELTDLPGHPRAPLSFFPIMSALKENCKAGRENRLLLP